MAIFTSKLFNYRTGYLGTAAAALGQWLKRDFLSPLFFRRMKHWGSLGLRSYFSRDWHPWNGLKNMGKHGKTLENIWTLLGKHGKIVKKHGNILGKYRGRIRFDAFKHRAPAHFVHGYVEFPEGKHHGIWGRRLVTIVQDTGVSPIEWDDAMNSGTETWSLSLSLSTYIYIYIYIWTGNHLKYRDQQNCWKAQLVGSSSWTVSG